MKQFFLTLFLISILKVTGYNQCEFLPISLPASSSSLMAANRTIAECFAPTIHQMVDFGPTNSLGGRADLITSAFYDDQDFTNNWENLGNFTLNEILPTVYYSVVWTENYWVVTYAFYHPRDYSDTGGLCCLDNHEHDLEGVFFLIDRASNNVEASGSIAHSTLYLHLETTTDPQVYIDDRTHAVKVDLAPYECIDDIGNCDDCNFFTSYNHVIYTFNNNIKDTDVGSGPNFISGTGTYDLVDIFSDDPLALGSLRNNSSFFISDKFVQSGTAGCQDEGLASAPWGWGQWGYNNAEIELLCCFAENSDQKTDGGNILFAAPSSLGGNCDLPNANAEVVLNNPYFPSPCTQPFPIINATQSGVQEINTDASVSDIRIAENSVTTFKDCTIHFTNPTSKMSIGNGAKVILDNVTFTVGCSNTMWSGIFIDGGLVAQNPDGNINPNEAGVIIIKNNSIIENSSFGVTNLENASLYYLCSYVGCQTGGTIIAENSVFNLNSFAATLVSNDADKSSFSSCKFTNNLFGIRTILTSGTKINKSSFYNSLFGVSSINSFINIMGDNSFVKNDKGIFVGGTFPLASAIEIGSMDYSANLFEENRISIETNGSTHPIGVKVENNIFKTYNLFDYMYVPFHIGLNGDNFYEVNNNDFQFGAFATAANSNSDNENVFRCNDSNMALTDMFYIGISNESEFLENNFSVNTSNGNVWLYDNAEIEENIGRSDNTAGNCFPNSILYYDIVNDSPNTFNYNYKSQVCNEPNSENGFVNVPFPADPDNCTRIGTFGLINPTRGPINGINLDTLVFDSICKICILTEITNILNEIPANNEEETELLEETLTQWIEFGILTAINTSDYTFGIDLLHGFNDWRWKIRKYSLYLMSGDIVTAENYLNSLSASSEDQIDFISIQNYFLDLVNNPNYQLSTTEIDHIKQIADKNISTRGYANSLLFMVANDWVDIIIPPFGSSHLRSSKKKERDHLNLDIKPAISSDLINVSTKGTSQIKKIEIFSSSGILTRIVNEINNEQYTLNMASHLKGIYFLKVYFTNGLFKTEKIIKI